MPAIKKPVAPKVEPRPGVDVGDDVYFNHPEGPRAGRVLSHGKHGCMIKCEKGEHHQVTWDKVLGHKKRARQRYTIVDEGEDGMIVEDAAGQRRFFATPPEAGEDRLVTKAINDRGRALLFMKADEPGKPTVGRPGLVKKQIVDRTGRKQTKWVRANKDQPDERKKVAPDQPEGRPLSSVKPTAENDKPKVKAGDKVNFTAGDFAGSGEVVGTHGTDGVHVKDSSGRVHQVRYSEMTSADQGEPAEKEPVKNADEIARALFNTSDLDKLPSKAAQPVNSWKELSAKAPQALDEFKGMLDTVADKLDLETGRRPQSLNLAQEQENEQAKNEDRKPKKLDPKEYMLPEHWDNDRGFLFIGPLKGEKRAREKVESEYEGDWSKVKDMVRATIAVPMVTQIPMVLRTLEAAGMKLAQKPKNNLVKPLAGGYRDINLLVRVPNGMLAELQIHVKPMTLAKERGHGAYEVSRSIEAKYKDKGMEDAPETWDPADREAHGKAMAEQEKIYGDAWEKATKPKPEPESDLSKSLRGSIMILWMKRGLK